MQLVESVLNPFTSPPSVNNLDMKKQLDFDKKNCIMTEYKLSGCFSFIVISFVSRRI
jgi:hypothetical protein